MKYFTLVIAAFIATLAVAQAQAIPNGPLPKLVGNNWKKCNIKMTPDQCGAGWTCVGSQYFNWTICANNTLYAKDSYVYKNNYCSVPGNADKAYAYNDYTCAAYGGVGTYPYGASNVVTVVTPVVVPTVVPRAVSVAPAQGQNTPTNVPVINLPRMHNCDVSRTCNKVIYHATGKIVTDASCYKIDYVSSDQFSNRSISNAVDAAGLPDGYNKLIVYKCLTMDQMNNGISGTVPMKAQDGILSVGTYMWQMVQSSQSMIQSQNGQEITNFYMQESNAKSGSGKLQVVRQKIMDFFHYAIIQGTGLNSTMVANATCDSTCGTNSFSQMCCAEMFMTNKNWVEGNNGWEQVDETDMTTVCINQSVASTDMSMNIAGAQVRLNCKENTMSKAMRLVSASAIALTAYVSI